MRTINRSGTLLWHIIAALVVAFITNLLLPHGGGVGFAMAAFATEDAMKVKNKVRTLLMDASPLAQEVFRKLFSFLSQQRGGSAASLQLLQWSAADAAAAGGTVLGNGVKKLYGFYTKKTATATQNTVKLYDDATDDTTAANAIVAADLRAASEETMQTWQAGKALATGLVVTAHTTLLGTTDGSAANAGSGFAIIG